jgi:pSer/pThr/pTyr-binding forkhead associated (FHA) protein
MAADRAQFDRAAPGGVEFPEGRAPAALLLRADEVDIGRDEAGGDPAVSRDHVTLVRQADGSWAAVDRGSTNGTTINDDPIPIEPGVEVPLADGDCIRLGAWTAITLHRVQGG